MSSSVEANLTLNLVDYQLSVLEADLLSVDFFFYIAMGTRYTTEQHNDDARYWADQLLKTSQGEAAPPFWLPWCQDLFNKGKLRSHPMESDGYWLIPGLLMVGPQPNTEEDVKNLIEHHDITTFVSVNQRCEYAMWYPATAAKVKANLRQSQSSKEVFDVPNYRTDTPDRDTKVDSLQELLQQPRNTERELLDDPYNARWLDEDTIENLRAMHEKKGQSNGVEFEFPITLQEHGVTQLTFPLDDGEIPDEHEAVQFAEHIALRLQYAYPLFLKHWKYKLVQQTLDLEQSVPIKENEDNIKYAIPVKATETPTNADPKPPSHEVLYVHCFRGRGRATTIAAMVLAATFNLTSDEALRYLRLCNSHRWEDSCFVVPQSENQQKFIPRIIPDIQKRYRHISDCESQSGGKSKSTELKSQSGGKSKSAPKADKAKQSNKKRQAEACSGCSIATRMKRKK